MPVYVTWTYWWYGNWMEKSMGIHYHYGFYRHVTLTDVYMFDDFRPWCLYVHTCSLLGWVPPGPPFLTAWLFVLSATSSSHFYMFLGSLAPSYCDGRLLSSVRFGRWFVGRQSGFQAPTFSFFGLDVCWLLVCVRVCSIALHCLLLWSLVQ